MADFQFLHLQHLARLRQPQLNVLHLRFGRAESNRHAEFESQIPAVVVVLRHQPVKAVERFAVVVVEKLVAESVDLVVGDEIEPGPHEVLSGSKLKIETADIPLVPPQFRTMRECFGNADGPVRREFRRDRLINGPQNRTVVDGQPDQPPQSEFRPIKLRQSRFRIGSRAE